MMSSLFHRVTTFFTPTSTRLAMAPESTSSASASAASASAAAAAAVPLSQSAPGLPEGAECCTVAAGCFWGTEHLYRRHFAGKGLLDARVGYVGGEVEGPSYRAVCGGRTGHAEAAQIFFDPAKITYAQLIEFFFRFHDPTMLNRQGPDTGTQYRSAIFYHGEEQGRVASDVMRRAAEQWWSTNNNNNNNNNNSNSKNSGGKQIVTEIRPAGKWWSAEEYHQLYLERNRGGYECPSHFLRDFPPLRD